MKIFYLIVCMLFAFSVQAQKVKNATKAKDKKTVSDVESDLQSNVKKPIRPDSVLPYILTANGDTINRTDEYNLRQGNWVIKSGGQFDEPLRTEMGNYIHGKKFGHWKIFESGMLISDENYYNNSLDGKSLYFENGMIVGEASYFASHRVSERDTIIVVNPITEEEKIVVLRTEGTSYRDGEWRYFNQYSGKLEKIEVYAIDELIKTINVTAQNPNDSINVAKSEKCIPHYQEYKNQEINLNSHIKMEKVQIGQKVPVFNIPQGLGRQRK